MPCGTPYIAAQINADGEVTACLQDWSDKYILGNIKDAPLLDILNNEKAIRFRKALLLGDWDYLTEIGYGGCKYCNTWNKKVNGNIGGIMEEHMPVRMGLVINELSSDRPDNTVFLEKAIGIIESGETDLIHALMERAE